MIDRDLVDRNVGFLFLWLWVVIVIDVCAGCCFLCFLAMTSKIFLSFWSSATNGTCMMHDIIQQHELWVPAMGNGCTVCSYPLVFSSHSWLRSLSLCGMKKSFIMVRRRPRHTISQYYADHYFMRRQLNPVDWMNGLLSSRHISNHHLPQIFGTRILRHIYGSRKFLYPLELWPLEIWRVSCFQPWVIPPWIMRPKSVKVFHPSFPLMNSDHQ